MCRQVQEKLTRWGNMFMC
ncbi:hypothetical protein HU200_042663 [Digitaria exilis]|uniref:Uncharacterized protein n=1 Tax=Digitaria exilis TaxID=1010633 RepID=A0A835B5H2_9POAL|nr:hypothetical protein HU200_042663 [Digitaria exilis]